VEHKIILGYDKKIESYWVPNGYHLNYNEFGSTREDYKKITGHQPIVWDSENLSLSDNIFELKLISEVNVPFIYYLEQYGPITNLTDTSNTTNDVGFLNNIANSTKEKLKNKQGVMIIVAVNENLITLSMMVSLHNSLVAGGICPSVCGYITGTNWNIISEYTEWCDNNNIKHRLIIINCYHDLYKKSKNLVNPPHSNLFVSGAEFEQSITTKRRHQLLSYNRRIKTHRYALLAMLYHNNLIEKNNISFSLAIGDNLNMMNPNTGLPGKSTMKTIVNDSKLCDLYLSYYDDLLKMSPQIVDFDLTTVNGYTENKYPYLTSYFSLVSETVFDQKSKSFTEKIFRPIFNFHPFILQGAPGSLTILRELGFKTFNPFIDESYDDEFDVSKRMEKLTSEVKRICSMNVDEMHTWYWQMSDILRYNREVAESYAQNKKVSLDVGMVEMYNKLMNNMKKSDYQK